MRIAYLTGASWRGGALGADGLPATEAPTHALLTTAGAAAGVAFDVRRWDDSALLSDPPSAALIRSCWDYPERAGLFLARLEALEQAGVRLINPAALVRWNMDKSYLAAFERAGAATIPTMFTDRCDARAVLGAFDTFDAAELVIKPTVGAGSRRTIRVRRNSWSEMDMAGAPQGGALLQPFLPAIETEGERSLFFFGGRYAYAILKRPAPGSWLANVAGARFEPLIPAAADRDLAARTMAAAPAGLTYARVDIVTGSLGAPVLIEVEAIEPHLFLDLAPAGAGDLFIGALGEALGAALGEALGEALSADVLGR